MLHGEAVYGIPLVDGGGQAGTVILTDGWVPGAQVAAHKIVSFGGVFPPGKTQGALQQFTIVREAMADEQGRMALEIHPALSAGVTVEHVASDNAYAWVREPSVSVYY
jgi:hypothetical protein